MKYITVMTDAGNESKLIIDFFKRHNVKITVFRVQDTRLQRKYKTPVTLGYENGMKKRTVHDYKPKLLKRIVDWINS